jgi:hypothetical protein
MSRRYFAVISVKLFLVANNRHIHNRAEHPSQEKMYCHAIIWKAKIEDSKGRWSLVIPDTDVRASSWNVASGIVQ